VEINRRPGTGGIIVQLPLPDGLDRQQALDCVLPAFDIDGLTSINQARLSAGSPNAYIPPTPAGILALLEHYKIRLQGKHVVIVGAGELVGKPLSRLLVQRGITVSVATAKTKNLPALTKSADIIIAGVGKPGIVRGDMVKKGVVVVDAGTSLVRKEGKTLIVGDVDFASVSKKASAITPVPGGVGPLTVAMLYKNFMISCLRLFETE
jgi:methylenetetrahydrofolate dehydrogenase (NADP+)/methenyltetrahydrofolate cyclohydrolase